jgi:hypothetical protein
MDLPRLLAPNHLYFRFSLLQATSRDTYSGLRLDKDGRVRLLESSSSLSMTEFCLEQVRKTLEILWQRFEACRFPALGEAAAQTANSNVGIWP